MTWVYSTDIVLNKLFGIKDPSTSQKSAESGVINDRIIQTLIFPDTFRLMITHHQSGLSLIRPQTCLCFNTSVWYELTKTLHGLIMSSTTSAMCLYASHDRCKRSFSSFLWDIEHTEYVVILQSALLLLIQASQSIFRAVLMPEHLAQSVNYTLQNT